MTRHQSPLLDSWRQTWLPAHHSQHQDSGDCSISCLSKRHEQMAVMPHKCMTDTIRLAPVKHSIVCVIDVNQTTGLKLGLSLQISEYTCMILLLSTQIADALGTCRRTCKWHFFNQLHRLFPPVGIFADSSLAPAVAMVSAKSKHIKYGAGTLSGRREGFGACS